MTEYENHLLTYARSIGNLENQKGEYARCLDQNRQRLGGSYDQS